MFAAKYIIPITYFSGWLEDKDRVTAHLKAATRKYVSDKPLRDAKKGDQQPAAGWHPDGILLAVEGQTYESLQDCIGQYCIDGYSDADEAIWNLDDEDIENVLASAEYIQDDSSENPAINIAWAQITDHEVMVVRNFNSETNEGL